MRGMIERVKHSCGSIGRGRRSTMRLNQDMKLNEIRDNNGAHYRTSASAAASARARARPAAAAARARRRAPAWPSTASRAARRRSTPPAQARLQQHVIGRTIVDVNLGRLQEALDAGRLTADATVDGAALVAAGVLRRAARRRAAARQGRDQGGAHHRGGRRLQGRGRGGREARRQGDVTAPKKAEGGRRLGTAAGEAQDKTKA